MRYRRITAAIFDVLMIIILLSFTTSIIPMSENVEKLTNQLYDLTSDISNIDSTKLRQIGIISYELDKEATYIYVIIALVLICYFILIPKYLNGQTIGARLRKVRIVDVNEEKVSLNQLVIMAIFNSGLIIVLLMPLLLYILGPIWYPKVTLFLMSLQLLFWIVSFILLLIKKRGIHDYIAKTKVIEVKR